MNNKQNFYIFALFANFIFISIIFCGCSNDKTKITVTGLKYTEVIEGTGTSAFKGNTVIINYIGTLPGGKEFDNTYKTGIPLEFKVGSDVIIKGLNEGILGMKPGGKRKLIIPPDLGYGPEGSGAKIQGNTFLLFDVELLEVK